MHVPVLGSSILPPLCLEHDKMCDFACEISRVVAAVRCDFFDDRLTFVGCDIGLSKDKSRIGDDYNSTYGHQSL